MSNQKDLSFKAFLKWIIHKIPKYPIEISGIILFITSMTIILLQPFTISLLIFIPIGFLIWFYLIWRDDQKHE